MKRLNIWHSLFALLKKNESQVRNYVHERRIDLLVIDLLLTHVKEVIMEDYFVPMLTHSLIYQLLWHASTKELCQNICWWDRSQTCIFMPRETVPSESKQLKINLSLPILFSILTVFRLIYTDIYNLKLKLRFSCIFNTKVQEHLHLNSNF